MAGLSKSRVCCGHAAGHFVGSQGASRAIGLAAAAMVFSSTCPRLASSIGGMEYGGTDRLTFGTLNHEQIGRTRAYVITKWRQSEIQQVKETKVPPPRTHGKVGDQVGGQCSAVRQNPACKVGAAVAAEHAPSPTPSMDNGSFRACPPWSFAPCLLLAVLGPTTYRKPRFYSTSSDSRRVNAGLLPDCRPSGDFKTRD
jgi:hypothetical protein